MQKTFVLSLIVAAWHCLAGQPPYNPSNLPAPKAELPAMPANGNGVYRISLERVMSPVTLTLWVEMKNGKGVKAAILPIQNQEGAWWPSDASALTVAHSTGSGQADGTVQGTVSFKMVPPRTRDQYKIMHWKKNRENPDYREYTGEPTGTGTVTLDLACTNHFGRGTYSITFDGKDKVSLAHNNYALPGKTYDGRAYLLRQPALTLPGQYQVELFVNDMLGNVPVEPEKCIYFQRLGNMFVRFSVAGDAVRNVATYAMLDVNQVGPMTIASPDLRVADDGYEGTFDVAHPKHTSPRITLGLTDMFRIGPRLFGKITVQSGDVNEFGPCIGLVPGTRDEAFWVRDPGPMEWPWFQEDAKPDEELAARALAESQQAVMPGLPPEAASAKGGGIKAAGFWTWRGMVARGRFRNGITCIYAPSFDLTEVEGAAKYRFDVTQEKGGRFTLSFEMDKPWHPFTNVWDQIPVHFKAYRFKVTAVDAEGNALDQPVQMRIREHVKGRHKPGVPVADQAPGWETVPMPAGGFGILKRPPFHGIVQKTDRTWRDAALLLARIRRDQPSVSRARVQSASGFGHWAKNSGDHGFSTGWSADTVQHLAYRAETSDPAERLWAESMLHFTVASLTAHLNGQRKRPYDYQQNTVLGHYTVVAACNAFVETGNEDFRKQALLAMGGIADLQVPNGSFATYQGSGLAPGRESKKPRNEWYGSIKNERNNSTYPTAELLYAFGRVRRDCKTDEFVEAETKAYEWAMENQVKLRDWPLHVCHSHSGHYPVWQHPQAALQFCRYLLEVAPEERRDVQLAAEIARWAEDVKINWERRDTGAGGQILPRIDKRDRYNNEPLVNNIQAAIVFEMLYQATEDKMWRAKGEALAVAVVQALSPDGEAASWQLVAGNTTFGNPKIPHVGFCFGWAAQILREYAALREKQP